jgi:hypothetical protein
VFIGEIEPFEADVPPQPFAEHGAERPVANDDALPQSCQKLLTAHNSIVAERTTNAK